MNIKINVSTHIYILYILYLYIHDKYIYTYLYGVKHVKHINRYDISSTCLQHRFPKMFALFFGYKLFSIRKEKKTWKNNEPPMPPPSFELLRHREEINHFLTLWEVWQASTQKKKHVFKHSKESWLVASTHLTNISQIWNLPQIGVKIKNIWNHHLDGYRFWVWRSFPIWTIEVWFHMGGFHVVELWTLPSWSENLLLEPVFLTQPMDPEKKSLNFIFPTKYGIPKSLKFSHWPSKLLWLKVIHIRTSLASTSRTWMLDKPTGLFWSFSELFIGLNLAGLLSGNPYKQSFY